MQGDDARADDHSEGHHGVLCARLVQVLGEGPRRGVGVVGLNRGAGPGCGAVGVGKLFLATVDDGDHDGVVDEAAEDGAVTLSQEHDAGGYLEILAHLQIVAEVDGISDDVVGEGSEVHIAHRLPRDHETRQHLGEVVGGDAVAEA